MPDQLNEQLSEIYIRQFDIEPYPEIWRSMQDFTLSRQASTPDEFWCLQHESVFTLGQAGKPEHILNAHDIPVVQSDRGGQVTYHGPGQLIIYLLIDVKRRGLGPRKLVDLIEQSIIKVLGIYGINATLKKGAPGVYVEGAKIAALGLRIKKGCSYHGLSLNINMDQTPFTWINPCGYEGLNTVQLKDLIANPPADLFVQVQDQLIQEIQERLSLL